MLVKVLLLFCTLNTAAFCSLRLVASLCSSETTLFAHLIGFAGKKKVQKNI